MARYREWAKSKEGFGLGMVQLVNVAGDLAVANMIAQHGYRSEPNPVAVRYDALDVCLAHLADRIPVATTVQMPRIGCGLAGGQWEKIEPLIKARLVDAGFDVRVYDYE